MVGIELRSPARDRDIPTAALDARPTRTMDLRVGRQICTARITRSMLIARQRRGHALAVPPLEGLRQSDPRRRRRGRGGRRASPAV